MSKLRAVDPVDCACNECFTGEHIPISEATAEHIALMLMGRMRNNTSYVFKLDMTLTVTGADLSIDDLEVTVRAEFSGFQWELPRLLAEQVVQARAMAEARADRALPSGTTHTPEGVCYRLRPLVLSCPGPVGSR